MQFPAREAKMNSQALFSCGLLHMDVSMLADQQTLISVQYRYRMQPKKNLLGVMDDRDE